MGWAANEVERLILTGFSPSKIAEKRRVSQDVTLRTLRELIGQGRLRRSDILYSISPDVRRTILDLLRTRYRGLNPTLNQVLPALRSRGIHLNWLDVRVVMDYRDAAVVLGDLYQDIYDLEVWIHRFLRATLENEYGPEEEGWWMKGVPLDVRHACNARREEDTGKRSDPWSYTVLTDLKRVADKQWAAVSQHLPSKIGDDKQHFLKDLDRLNNVRNRVMHPVRGDLPSEEDFEFVRSLKKRLLAESVSA